MSLAAGSRLGPYVVRERLGHGAMGEVYRALDPRLGREVAIKVLPVELAASPRALSRFEREARAVAALSHPNVLVLHDVGADGERRYVVTELLEGQSLADRLSDGPLPWREVIEIGAAVADGLQAAHARGIVHRDLKPANLFLAADGRVKVLDFGVALFLRGEGEGGSGERTLPGSVLGSIGYMSPEQAAGEELDQRSDVFALGCVLYEALAGRRAFAGANLPETMAALARDQPPPLDSLVPEVPPELVAVIERCLRKRPSERFATAGDLALALRSTSSGSLTLEPRPSAAAGFGRWWRGLTAALPRPRRLRSLAVLPLANAGADPEADYLAEGVTESIIRTLSRLPHLRVLAWSTVARYRGRPLDPREVARVLEVDAVLVGRLLERGPRLVVTAELVEGRSGECLWSERYTRPAAALLDLHEEIAREVSQRLRTRLSGRDREQLRRRPTRDPDAFRLYLKGRYFWNRRSEEGLQRSRELFRAAIARDPRFALAHAGLADAYQVLPFWGLLPPAEAFAQGKAAARAALALEPRLAEAHAALAYALLWADWDGAAAEAEFRLALAYDPGYATAHHWHGVALALGGDLAAAEAALQRAQELEPLALIIQADQALVRWWHGDWQRARAQCRSVLELDPGFAPAQLYLGLACEQLGETEAAIEALRRAAAGGGTAARAALAHAYASSGAPALARQGLQELGELAGERYVSPYLLGVLHLGLDEPTAACEWLERGVAEGCEMMPWLERDPRLQPLHGEPRFAALVRTVRLARGGEARSGGALSGPAAVAGDAAGRASRPTG